MKVGILGGGQLGLMLSQAATRLGVETLVLDPARDAVAGQVTRHLAADWLDPAALDALAACDVVTYEFENVPSEAVEKLAGRVSVHPAPEALVVSGDRLLEKRFFRELGIEPAPFAPIASRVELGCAVADLGLPIVLKTRRFGYDGKGQIVVRANDVLDAAWSKLGGEELILEGFVPFERELSLAGVRGRDGEIRFWPLSENHHVDGILHVSRAPAANVADALVREAQRGLRAILERLDYVGVLVVELFAVGDRLLANEMACRVHNSYHWTIEGAVTSQFENHVRAVAGLPLGETAMRGEAGGFAAMVNLVGSLPDLAALSNEPGIAIHDYGKPPRPGRKLGHVSAVADSRGLLESRIRRILAVAGDRATGAPPRPIEGTHPGGIA
ncbi:5-(carboxyamino)imidazole ribonucleotide synthase [Myxococcota bacterium]|nr:5-(carboxyamino)imidazole ribonucleotide synthase [Myxococcota bacterium]